MSINNIYHLFKELNWSSKVFLDGFSPHRVSFLALLSIIYMDLFLYRVITYFWTLIVFLILFIIKSNFEKISIKINNTRKIYYREENIIWSNFQKYLLWITMIIAVGDIITKVHNYQKFLSPPIANDKTRLCPVKSQRFNTKKAHFRF